MYNQHVYRAGLDRDKNVQNSSVINSQVRKSEMKFSIDLRTK